MTYCDSCGFYIEDPEATCDECGNPARSDDTAERHVAVANSDCESSSDSSDVQAIWHRPEITGGWVVYSPLVLGGSFILHLAFDVWNPVGHLTLVLLASFALYMDVQNLNQIGVLEWTPDSRVWGRAIPVLNLLFVGVPALVAIPIYLNRRREIVDSLPDIDETHNE